MNPVYTSIHLIMKILTSAAINQRIDAPAVFLCVLTAFSIDSLRSKTNCAETVGTQAAEKHTHIHKHIFLCVLSGIEPCRYFWFTSHPKATMM